MFTERDEFWMQQAYVLANHAAEIGEVPVGAILVVHDEMVGQGYNSSITNLDPCAHAEIKALRHGAQTLNNYRLTETTLYVTLEPCLMCAGALVHARIGKLIYGARDPKAGAIVSQLNALDQTFLNHRVSHAGGLMAAACGELLSQFFRSKRMTLSERT